MILKALKYKRLDGNPKEWSLEDRNEEAIQFGNLNLIVGRNATGKSRTLGIIREIGELLSLRKTIGDIPFKDDKYFVYLDNNGDKYEYVLEIEDNTIVNERILVNDVCKLDRKAGKIFSEKTKEFTVLVLEPKSLAVEQHTDLAFPFLDNLFMWGRSVYKANFTNQIEKKQFGKSMTELESCMTEDIQSSQDLLNMFFMAKRMYGKNFEDKVFEDMNALEYPISSIEIQEGKKGTSIAVQEEELDAPTSQFEMSQGMYRALSFIVQLNCALLNESSICILIDDLGEGLDFARSKQLISLIIKKIKDSNIQLFLTTNDRLMMNTIPIKYWTVLERNPKKTIAYNYPNSKDNFEDFKYTGLSNFDFLTTLFYINGFKDAEE